MSTTAGGACASSSSPNRQCKRGGSLHLRNIKREILLAFERVFLVKQALSDARDGLAHRFGA
ncbi:hypothetical protein [Paraburkholderia sp. UCT2]|uniref:hypothetical protein n=1 Tax=Paraburkholderia sp. UCT2 TaxID=2615208 RepID=UPI0016566EF5|nr:hypothetical protein [Paraburkholderia sp. UCT2]MBC8728691.1 hypothetical protein [Paraburkholderia sp. UCT2]